jgi:holo-[acyl-carrier protein] synthase
MYGIGNDIIEIERIAKAIERHGQRFLDHLFTEGEQRYCLTFRQSERHFAARFAAKEATAKALGTGISGDLGWLDMEVVNLPSGKPTLHLSERASQHFGAPHILLSLSHCKEYATAVVIVTGS